MSDNFPTGSLVLLTSGSYSDYSVSGLVRAPQGWNEERLYAARREYDCAIDAAERVYAAERSLFLRGLGYTGDTWRLPQHLLDALPVEYREMHSPAYMKAGFIEAVLVPAGFLVESYTEVCDP